MDYQVKYFTINLSESSPEYFLTQSSKVFELVREDFSPLQESMYVIILNTSLKLLLKREIARGGLLMVGIQPSDLFRQVLIAGGSHFIICHNHPSGTLEPSNEDIEFTRKIKSTASEIGLDFLDHIIFSDSKYMSMKDEGII